MNKNTASPLEDILQYQNYQIIKLFSRKKKIPIEEAEFLFVELKKWLWFLGQRDESKGPFPMFPEQSIIDEFWHEFILSTKDYEFFCATLIGRFIHHIPTPDGVTEDDLSYGVHADLINKDEEKYVLEKSRLLKSSMLEVADSLGVETIDLWYRQLPRKYYFPEFGK
ncbi:hypothetical protein BH10PSE18_BH10PSE18_27790 [soil metagenome]